jgi:hypothetical protein
LFFAERLLSCRPQPERPGSINGSAFALAA